VAVGREHPSKAGAERATFISPSGEKNEVRPALHFEGCSATSYQSPIPKSQFPISIKQEQDIFQLSGLISSPPTAAGEIFTCAALKAQE
jgi:hypothetical protein